VVAIAIAASAASAARRLSNSDCRPRNLGHSALPTTEDQPPKKDTQS
jgi:hypothetical protein